MIFRPFTQSWCKFIHNPSINFNFYAWVVLITINDCKEITPQQLIGQIADKVLLL